MLFPRNRLKWTSTFKGKTDPDGWLVLDLAGADLEGATKVYISADEIDRLRKQGDTASKRLLEARALLGGDDE